MKVGKFILLVCGLSLLGTTAGSHRANAYSNYFTNKCAGCHANDNPTCNGCHHHGTASLSAVTDKVTYVTGEQVMVTLRGGSKSGWIRTLLFDQNGVEIARATGPTGAGDDGLPNPVVYPVVLSAPAPIAKGTYTWEAAWWGSPYETGNLTVTPHGPEVRVPVVVSVTSTVPVESTTWSRIKSLFR